ncbi:MAG: argininosuccinate lyase [Fimbriimonadaceae bacterium]|nr:MAG: argininosuccinate lyase [Fimbriimonadaceae bacterium]
MSSRLWDKGLPMDQKILEFTVGKDFILDARLVRFDIEASIAHVRMLGKCGYLNQAETEKLVDTLLLIGQAHEDGNWTISLEQEDCHTAIESQLIVHAGELGGKVHLGRSRNDQVLVAMRLYLREVVSLMRGAIKNVTGSLEKLADQQGTIAIPGYTHMQQAMPSSVSHWANGFASEITANEALLDAADQLANLNPLGSAAGYGTPGLKLDREFTTSVLGFSKTQEPVTACQLSRGKAESALAFALVQILNDLGRLSSDICLFATQEYALVKLGKDVSTGSSIMPQKRNPDVFELIRAHSAQASSDMQAIIALTAKMTSGYHRDLQLIKEPLFRLIDRTFQVAEITSHALRRIEFDPERAKEITDPSINQAEEAYALVQSEGISFREAYKRVAEQNM